MHLFYQKRKQWYNCKESKDLSYPSHLHKEVEIVFVLSGEIEITINGKSQILKENSLAIAFPNTIHSYSTKDTSKVVCIIFDGYVVPSHTNQLNHKIPSNPFILSENIHKDIHYSIYALYDLSYVNTQGMTVDSERVQEHNNLVKGFLMIILSRIFQQLQLEEGGYDDLNLIHQLLTYIDNHYTEPLTLDLVAKDLNASKYYISRVFHNKLNTSFNDYINDMRIRLSEYLLCNTNLSITEVCFQAGFESTRTFYRAFKRLHAMSPSEYRKHSK